jgi:hypothetical protein
MKRISCLLGCLLLAGSVHAQYLPLPATNSKTAPTAPTVIRVAPGVIDSVAIDEHAVNQKLREKNVELQRQNADLGVQLVSLKASLEAYTSKGGSAVHAYCEDSPTAASGISRTTAGVVENCAATSGYLCETVTGLCRTTCQTTAMCAPGWVCDTDAQHCQPQGGG